MSASDRPSLARHARARDLALALAIVALLVLAAFPGPPPTHDGPHHVALAHLHAHLGEPLPAKYLVANVTVSNWAFDALSSRLDAAFGWQRAFRIVALVGALVWAGGVWALRRALDSRSPWVWVALARAFPWHFHMGFYSFWLASGLSLFVIALGVRLAPAALGGRALLGVLLLGLAGLHAFPALLAAGVVACSALADPRPTPLLRRWTGVVLGALPMLAWVALTPLLVPAAESDDGRTSTWLHGADHALLGARTLLAGPLSRSLPVLLLALGGAIWALARGDRRARALGAASLVLVALAFAAPFHLASWYFFSPRFLLVGATLGLLLLPAEVLPRRLDRVVAPAVVLAFLAVTPWLHRSLRQSAAPYLAGLGHAVPARGRTLPLILDPGPTGDIAHASPFVNFGHLYLAEQGGMNPYLFATRPALHPLLYRAPPRDLFPEYPNSFFYKAYGSPAATIPEAVQRVWLASLASRYDDVILYGKTDEDVDELLRRGFHADFREGRLLLARFEGCRVEMKSPRPLDRPAVFSYAMWPLFEEAGDVTLAASADSAVAQFPCGRVRIMLAGGDAEPRVCRNWPGQREVVLELKGKMRVHCDLGAAPETGPEHR